MQAVFRQPVSPGFPLQVLGSAHALPVGFPLQSLASAQRRGAMRNYFEEKKSPQSRKSKKRKKEKTLYRNFFDHWFFDD
jgi:hypothetical protein